MTTPNKKHLAQKQQTPWVVLLVGCVLVLVAYGFVSWALDSGSVFVYAAAFTAAYFGVRSIVRAAKQFIRK